MIEPACLQAEIGVIASLFFSVHSQRITDALISTHASENLCIGVTECGSQWM